MIPTHDSGQWPKKKLITLSLFLLAVLVGRGQTIAQPASRYDTIKVIAEVYQKAKKEVGPSGSYWMDSTGHLCWRYAEYWSWDSTEVHTRKVCAWEVWRQEFKACWVPSPDGIGMIDSWQWQDVERVKRLAYNKKDTLPNVLQTWRVEW